MAFPLSEKRYFLFDMDGTLVDSTWLWDTYLNRFLSRYQFSADTEAQRQFDTLPLRESASYIAGRYGPRQWNAGFYSLDYGDRNHLPNRIEAKAWS